MNLELLGDRVLIKTVDQRNERAEAIGLIVPDKANREAPYRGQIVLVGPDVEGFGVGDDVLFEQYDFNVIEVDGQEYSIGTADRIIGFLVETEV